MNDIKATYDQIWSRSDGSFVVLQNGLPRHIPNNAEYREEWQAVYEYGEVNPVAIQPEPGPSAEDVKQARLDEIKALLTELDSKLIRPLSEGETERVREIVAEKLLLREELERLELEVSNV